MAKPFNSFCLATGGGVGGSEAGGVGGLLRLFCYKPKQTKSFVIFFFFFFDNYNIAKEVKDVKAKPYR